MPGLSRFSRKQPLSQESNTNVSTTGDKDGTTPAPSAGNGDGGAPSSVPPSSNSGVGNAEPTNGGGRDNVANFSTSLEDRPATSGSNSFADFGNMFTMEEHNGVNSNMILDSTFLSSTPTEGMGDGGMMVNNNMFGDNSFMQGFESRPSTGEGGNAFQFGDMNGFDSEGVDAEQLPTTANGGNETKAKRTADAPSAGRMGGGVGIGFFAKRRAVPTASTAATSNLSGQPENVNANSSPPNGLTSTASSIANLSQFDTNLLSENKNENDASSSGNVQIPKSIATNGGDVEDDLTVGTTTSVAPATVGGVVNAAPPAAKSPYFSGAGAVNQSDIQARNATPESSPSKEEIIIPGMNVSTEKSGENTDIDATAETTKRGGVLAPNASFAHTQRVSLSPPDAKMNHAATNVNANSIVIPGVNNDNIDLAQTMMQLGGATNGKTSTAVSTAINIQRVNGAFTSSSALSNNTRGGIGVGRFNGTEKVKFVLPESSTKTAPMKSTANMNTANTTVITPDHRNGAKQALATPYARPSAGFGPNQQNAVTPIPHKTVQYDSAPDRVVPGMPTEEDHDNVPNEMKTGVDLQDRTETMGDSVRSPTPTMKNDVATPKASNLNTGGGYSGSSVLTTHESFDELLSQLDGDLTEATDLHNKGNLDLLHLEVALTHAYAKALQTKGQYVDLLDEIDAVSCMGESIMIELED